MCQCAKFDQFLPARSHFDSKHPENCVRIATFPSATFGPLFAFHCPLFFTKNNNLECKIVTLRHSRCFENGNVDFGVEVFWAIHCAHWSSGFMVLNASISRVLGQRPTFYCPLFVLCFVFWLGRGLHITVQSMYNVHTEKKNNNTTRVFPRSAPRVISAHNLILTHKHPDFRALGRTWGA